MAKNRTGVLTHPPAIVQRTGVNRSIAFARGQHAYPKTTTNNNNYYYYDYDYNYNYYYYQENSER